MVGGLRGATLVVEGGAAGMPILAEGQPGIASNIAGLLTRLRDAAGCQIIDIAPVQPRALDQFLVGQCQQLRGVKIVQITHADFAAGNGRADCFNNNGFSHGSSSIAGLRAVRPPR